MCPLSVAPPSRNRHRLLLFSASVPQNTHSYRNVGEGNALIYTIYTPAGMEGWFREVFERVRPGEFDMAPPPADEAMIARMLDAGPRYNVEWVPA